MGNYSALTTGAIIGILLAVVVLAFGFWAFVLALVFGAIGAVIAGAITGTLNVRAAFDALRGRRTL
jgi:uncharacterized membrane protein